MNTCHKKHIYRHIFITNKFPDSHPRNDDSYYRYAAAAAIANDGRSEERLVKPCKMVQCAFLFGFYDIDLPSRKQKILVCTSIKHICNLFFQMCKILEKKLDFDD